MNEYIEANRANWNDRVPIHVASQSYDVEGFVADSTKLRPGIKFDSEHLGDVNGKSLLHLMCHFGLDTLSWARLGATVTGVDFSANAIESAQQISERIGIESRFVQSDIYDAPNVLRERFDIVYTSIGVLCWLPDISKWARVVSKFLKPGGTFYIREIHPIAWSLDLERGDGLVSMKDPYFEVAEPLGEAEEYTYTDGGTRLEHQMNYCWNHGMGEIVTALIEAGLQIVELREYPYVQGWGALPGMVNASDGMYHLPDNDQVPLMYHIRASKT